MPKAFHRFQSKHSHLSRCLDWRECLNVIFALVHNVCFILALAKAQPAKQLVISITRWKILFVDSSCSSAFVLIVREDRTFVEHNWHAKISQVKYQSRLLVSRLLLNRFPSATHSNLERFGCIHSLSREINVGYRQHKHNTPPLKSTYALIWCFQAEHTSVNSRIPPSFHTCLCT